MSTYKSTYFSVLCGKVLLIAGHSQQRSTGELLAARFVPGARASARDGTSHTVVIKVCSGRNRKGDDSRAFAYGIMKAPIGNTVC